MIWTHICLGNSDNRLMGDAEVILFAAYIFWNVVYHTIRWYGILHIPSNV